MTAAVATPAIASETPSAAELTNNTLVWPGPDGEPLMIHFGRFENFDRYIPCTFESGLWAIDGEGHLDLTYDNPRIAAQRYVLSGKPPAAITMTSPGGETFVAELKEGDHLPWF
ncbi:MAG: hypothetical protein VW644_09655 [Alphaproteobacteria bacterium]